MNPLHRKRRRVRFFRRASITVLLILVLISIIPVRLAIANYQSPTPQAIFTLGGGEKRETFTAQLAQLHPSLEIWVSSGITSSKARDIFQSASIPNSRVHLDYCAIDTVTNFTTLVAEFKRRNIQHLYLITSEFHMPRAKAIATLVLGSRGITFTPVAIPSRRSPESWFSILRDSTRALIWIFTRRTGASLYRRQTECELATARQAYNLVFLNT